MLSLGCVQVARLLEIMSRNVESLAAAVSLLGVVSATLAISILFVVSDICSLVPSESTRLLSTAARWLSGATRLGVLETEVCP